MVGAHGPQSTVQCDSFLGGKCLQLSLVEDHILRREETMALMVASVFIMP